MLNHIAMNVIKYGSKGISAEPSDSAWQLLYRSGRGYLKLGVMRVWPAYEYCLLAPVLTLELKYSSHTESKKERRYIGHVSCLAELHVCHCMWLQWLLSLHVCACLINCVSPWIKPPVCPILTVCMICMRWLHAWSLVESTGEWMYSYRISDCDQMSWSCDHLIVA